MSSVSYYNNQVLARWMDADYGQKPSQNVPAAPADTEMEEYSSDYLALTGFVESIASAMINPKVAGGGLLAVAGIVIGVAASHSKDQLPQLGNVTSTTGMEGNGLNCSSALKDSEISVFKPIQDVNGTASLVYSHGFHPNKITDSFIGKNNAFANEVVLKAENLNIPKSLNNNSNSSIVLKSSEVSVKNQVSNVINKADFCFKNETKQFKISDLVKAPENNPGLNNSVVGLPKAHTIKPLLISAGQKQMLGLNNTFTYKKETNEIAKPVATPIVQEPVMQEPIKQQKTISEMFTNTTTDELPVCKYKPLSTLEKRISEVISELPLLPLPKDKALSLDADISTDAHIETEEEAQEARMRYMREQCGPFGKRGGLGLSFNEMARESEPYKLLDKKTTSLEAIQACHTYAAELWMSFDRSWTKTYTCQDKLEKHHYTLLETDSSDLQSKLAKTQIKLLDVNSALNSENTKLQTQHTQNAETVAKLKKMLGTSDLWENIDEEQAGNLKNRISGIISGLNPVKASEESQVVLSTSDITPIVITDGLRNGATKGDLEKCEGKYRFDTTRMTINEDCWSKWFPKAVELKKAEHFNLNAQITKHKNEITNSQNALDSVIAKLGNAVIQNNEASEQLKNLLADLNGAE